MSEDGFKIAAAAQEAAKTATKRKAGGQWAPGTSGNPGGKGQRERSTILRVRELAGNYSEEAVKGLVNIARNRRATHATRIAAWSAILDRAVGKPSSPPAIAFDDGTPVPVYQHTYSDIEVARRIASVLGEGMRALSQPSVPVGQTIDADEESGEGEET
jgi:hypothetical protein